MHLMDADETYGEKARRKLQKNASSYIGQILEATPHETTAVWPFTTIALLHIDPGPSRQSRNAPV